MKLKLLALAVLSGVCISQAVVAQEYDDRWYLTGTAGWLGTDSGRGTDDSEILGIGIGKRIRPNLSLELSGDRATPSIDYDSLGLDNDWYLHSINATARYYFTEALDTWSPYLAFGLGSFRHHEQRNSGIPNRFQPGYGGERIGWNFGAILGAGIESERMKRVDYRFEAGLRYDDDSNGDYWPRVPRPNAEFQSYALDYYVAGSLLVKLGNLDVPVVAAAPTCDTLDSDNDGVNDCNDKCSGSTAGQTIGADGCPVKLTIDLKGVNFDFNKNTLRPDAVVILDEAVAVLAKYPELKVGVDGYTDQCGNEEYNQQLSQKRAAVVFQYLVDKGITSDRLTGPTGYGEGNPLADSGQAYPGCKNESNRRTELNVQN